MYELLHSKQIKTGPILLNKSLDTRVAIAYYDV